MPSRNENADSSTQSPVQDVIDSPCELVSLDTANGSHLSLNIFQTSGPPEICEVLNSEYQRRLGQVLETLQLALDNAIEAQREIKEELEYLKKCPSFSGKFRRCGKSITLFASPYFRDVRGRVAPENDDAKIKRINCDIDAYLAPPRPWTTTEHNCLINAVVKCALEAAVKAESIKQGFIKEKLHRDMVSVKKEEQMQSRLEAIEEKIEELRRMSKKELISLYEDKVDWMYVSAGLMSGTRTAEECEYMWKNYLHPSINKKKFSADEDEMLEQLASYNKFRDWDNIAVLLGTNRTAIQCLQRYQSHLNDHILNKFWTPEEDALLKNIVELCRIGDYIPWHLVSYYIPGRSRLQITNRWHRNVDPVNRGGPWTEQEDAILCAAVQKFGNRWCEIAKLLPGRSNYSCRERYTNNLVPGLRIGNWSQEEDALLMKMIAKYGEGRWSKICLNLPGRTDNMCLQRAGCIKKQNPERFKIILRQLRKHMQNGTPLEEITIKQRIAPSNRCLRANDFKRKVVINARQELINAVMEVKGFNEPPPKYDLSRESIKSLREMSKHLLAKDSNVEKPPLRLQYFKMRRNPMSFYKYRQQLEKEEREEANEQSETDESDDEDEETQNEDASDIVSYGKQETAEEEEKLQNELFDLFSVRANLHRHVPKSSTIVTSRDMTEFNIFRRILFQYYNVNDQRDPEDVFECEKEKFDDFNDSVPKVLNCFVLPAPENNDMPVLPPALTNMKAIEICLVARRILFQQVDNMSKAHKANFEAVSDDSPNCLRKCAFCRKIPLVQSSDVALNEETLEKSNSSSALKNNPSKNNIILPGDYPNNSESLLPSVNGETSSAKQNCECEVLQKMREQFLLLRKRFISTFLWPGILSLTEIPIEKAKTLFDTQVVLHSSTKKYGIPGTRCLPRGRPRKKAWVTEMWKKYHKEDEEEEEESQKHRKKVRKTRTAKKRAAATDGHTMSLRKRRRSSSSA